MRQRGCGNQRCTVGDTVGTVGDTVGTVDDTVGTVGFSACIVRTVCTVSEPTCFQKKSGLMSTNHIRIPILRLKKAVPLGVAHSLLKSAHCVFLNVVAVEVGLKGSLGSRGIPCSPFGGNRRKTVNIEMPDSPLGTIECAPSASISPKHRERNNKGKSNGVKT